MGEVFINKIRTIYCIGRNYAAHAKELDNDIPKSPVLFLKSASSARTLTDTGKIAYPLETFHHELELTVFIGKDESSNDSDPFDQVTAIGLGLDVTRRDVQKTLKNSGLPWTEAKSFVGSAVFSRPIPLSHEITAYGSEWPTQLAFDLLINGVKRQSGSPKQMIFDLRTLLCHVRKSHGLHAGDVIFTGTPSGVGPLIAGDEIRMVMTLAGQVILDESGVF